MIGKRVKHKQNGTEGVVVEENGIMLTVRVSNIEKLEYEYKDTDNTYLLVEFDRRWVEVIEEDKMVDIIVYGTQAWRDHILKMEKEVNEEMINDDK